MILQKKVFGTTAQGDKIHSFILKNDFNMEVEIIEFGATVLKLKTADKNGVIDDIVLGYDNLDGYINDVSYFGATVGRVASRMGGAQFTLDGEKYELTPNTLPDFGKNQLHGGVKGFNKGVWKGEEFENKNKVGVILSYISKDGEEGYPGNLSCQVKYTLNNENELGVEYYAQTDKPTIVNLTHHSYFNLKGEGSGNVLNQQVLINADKYTPLSDDLLPTGQIENVNGPYDFTELRSIASQIDDMQLPKYKGYDTNYVVKHKEPNALDFAAKAVDLSSGRVMEVFTTQPCMHFYTSNFLIGEPGKGGKPYELHGAFCFEPQGFPDAPNNDNFTSIVLRPNEEYKQTIIYKFSVE